MTSTGNLLFTMGSMPNFIWLFVNSTNLVSILSSAELKRNCFNNQNYKCLLLEIIFQTIENMLHWFKKKVRLKTTESLK